MPRFFVRAAQIDHDMIQITGDDAHHIAHVLRMAAGDVITVCDMQRHIYTCRLIQFGDGFVTASILSSTESDTEPPYHAALYQAAVKGDKFDTIIQKAVESGVGSITPFLSERCIAKWDDRAEKKLVRWQRIAEAAAKQSGRGIIPEIRRPLTFDAMLAEVMQAELPLFCYEGDGTLPLPFVLAHHRAPETIAMVIGPEGGFSLKEAEAARQAGANCIGLGKRILRTETASSFVLSCLVYAYELQSPC